MTKIVETVDTVNTTAVRILVSILLAVIVVIVVLIGLVIRIAWTSGDITVMKLLGVLLLIMMGIDVTQMAMKRYTDNTYVAAKGEAKAKVAAATTTPSPISAGPAGTVVVQPATTEGVEDGNVSQ